MTLGQRIAQKRKELGLSQEGLGEQLGVSRQAIYKWESDTSLPEIDKLITLSKLFSVSVGWLLGVEEKQEDAPPQASNELTETQLQMVQEIVDRYLAAQPAPAPPKHRRLVQFCGAAAVLCLIAALFNLFSKLDRMTQDYNSLQYSFYDINRNVNSQIGSITGRVEEILKSQNDLTAAWSAELVSTDLRANTATFEVWAAPKTYVEGMTAIFVARSGEDSVELPVELGTDHAFSGKITCPLSDKIDITAILVTGDKRETQWLNDFYNLYSDTFPVLKLDSWLFGDERDGVLPNQISTENHSKLGITVQKENNLIGWNPDPPAKLQVGLFRDRKLVMWYQGGMEKVWVNNTRKDSYVWRRPEDVTLEPGHIYIEAAVYTDALGRQFIYEGRSPLEYSTVDQDWLPPSSYALDSDPSNWEF